ncbi:MAG: hypothetical protein H6732_07540 [Alphaproteobacteria bacterium]|nr:hypothetical protein [Alphaproteobacteria bacterium]
MRTSPLTLVATTLVLACTTPGVDKDADSSDTDASDSGDSGDSGPADTGFDTSLGDSGDSGSVGDSGDSGDSGSAGDSGDSGSAGDSGDSGDSGSTVTCTADAAEPNDTFNDLADFDFVDGSASFTFSGTLDPRTQDIDIFWGLVPAGCTLEVDMDFVGQDGDVELTIYSASLGTLRNDGNVYIGVEETGTGGSLQASFSPETFYAPLFDHVFFTDIVILEFVEAATTCVTYDLTVTMTCDTLTDTGTAAASCDDGDPDEENDFIGQATATGVSSGGSSFLRSGNAADGVDDDADLYAFSVDPGCAATFATTNVTEDVDVMVLSPEGYPRFAQGNARPEQRIVFRNTSTNVRNYTGAVYTLDEVCATYDLEVSVTCGGTCAADGYEDNDSAAAATATLVDADDETFDGSGSIDAPDDLDYFAFSVPAACGYEVALDFEDADGDLILLVLDSTGALVGVADTKTDGELHRGSNPTSAAVDLFARVNSFDGVCNDYDIDVKVDCDITDCPLDPQEPSSFTAPVVTGMNAGGQTRQYTGTAVYATGGAFDGDPFSVSIPAGCTLGATLAYTPTEVSPYLGIYLPGTMTYATIERGTAGAATASFVNAALAPVVAYAAVEAEDTTCMPYTLDLELTCP